MVYSTAVVAAILAAAPTGALRTSVSVDYEEFRAREGVYRDEDAEGYLARVALFEQRREEVERHNARAGIRWTMVVNKFADFTQEEFQAMLGHRPIRHHVQSGAAPSVFVELSPRMPLATAVDWSLKLNSTTLAKNQGACGSCWAVASAGALETHAEALGHAVPEVSYEQLVDCVQNVHECGGTGGCKGATSELAFEYVKLYGLSKRSDYQGYQSNGDGTCHPTAKPVLTSTGFVRLEENKVQPLLEAVATQGPVTVSAEASAWSMYDGGVFDECGKNATINHAILLMGYGHDTATKSDYWLIRNSWGPTWGEKGYIRLLRHQGDEYCGTDSKPLEGVGCKGGPAEMRVCGMCGILSDSAYPTGVALAPAS